MTETQVIDQLLELIRKTGQTPEEVCAAQPELLPQVQAHLAKAQREIDALFPSVNTKSLHDEVTVSMPLPRIEGYDVEGILGSGGMGVVYRARHRALDRLVAVKMVRGGGPLNDADLERFRREYRVLADLNHPRIVQVYDVGMVEHQPYFAMELVSGVNLESALGGVPQSSQDAAEMLLKLAEAVQAAHAHGIIHRDLKPSNVLLTIDREPKIADFGLAKSLEDGPGLTVSGAGLGTPSYMAPEQAIGGPDEIGPLVDVYALGAILYQMLTGRPPFRGVSKLHTMQQVVSEDPISPSLLNSKVHRDLETICLKCLEKDRHRRYPSAEELAGRLRLFLSGRPIPDRPIGAVELLWRWCRRNRSLAAAGGLSFVLLITVAVLSTIFGWVQQHSASESRRQAALSAWDRAHQLCKEGQIGKGLLVFAKTLQSLPGQPSAVDLPWALGTEMQSWHQRSHTLRQVFAHPDRVLSLACPDGQTLGTTCADGKIRLWDLSTSACRATLSGHVGPANTIAFHPQGQNFLTGGDDGQVLIWDILTGQKTGDLEHSESPVQALAFSPDGQQVLTARMNGEVRLWNSMTRSCLAVLDFGARVNAVGFDSTGTRFFIGGERDHAGEVRIYPTKEPVVESPLLTQQFRKAVRTAVFFSDPLQALLVGDSNWDISFLDYRDRQQVSVTDFFRGQVNAVAIDQLGRSALIGTEDSSTAYLWDLSTLGDYFAAQRQGRVNLTGDRLPKPILPILLHPLPITGVAFVPPAGEHFVTACDDGFVRLWQRAPGPVIRALPHSPREQGRDPYILRAAAIDPEGRLTATGGDDGQIRLWNTFSGREEGDSLTTSSPVVSMVFSHDGRQIVAGSRDGFIRIWDIETRRETGPPILHDGGISGLSRDPDSNLILVGGAGRAQLWNLTSKEPVGNPLQHGGPELSLATAIAPRQERFLTTAEDGTVKLWNRDGQLIRTMKHQQKDVRAAGFSPNGALAISGGDDGYARIWDAVTGDPRMALAHDSDVFAVVFLTNDRVLTGSRSGAQLWDLATRRRIGAPCKFLNDVMAVQCSNDGKTAVLADWSGSGVIWTLPQPIVGNSDDINRWIESQVGLKLDDVGESVVLSGQEWVVRQTYSPRKN